ncbi:hypothetical protein SeMB42_g03401 [Synchytrium endobioticum]|uniref:ATP synthase F(0) complex subunit e, mitochondrial n=1 Tax=Synchytrium endobioticum TaxID=286115 RepID=A0A507CSD9_9FUNG|nr:hypothetical protein SeLEV6574_g05782 [Synchytrium endobioticum]TPX47237.1 hypothetical protein SeMB42_g03401 [Synchytrium endobioticum]
MGSSIVNYASVNYLRFGALGLGLYWGMSRQASLTDYVKKRNHELEKHHHEELVEEGRLAYEQAENRRMAELALKDGVVSDPDSYRFNAERWLNWTLAYYEGKKDTEMAQAGQK